MVEMRLRPLPLPTVRPSFIFVFFLAGQKWLTSWGYTNTPALDNDKLMDFGLRVTKAIIGVHGRHYGVEAAGKSFAGGTYRHQ